MNIEEHEPPRGAWYTGDQLTSPEPHVVIEATVRAGPGLGEDTAPRTVDVVLSWGAYERLMTKRR